MLKRKFNNINNDSNFDEIDVKKVKLNTSIYKNYVDTAEVLKDCPEPKEGQLIYITTTKDYKFWDGVKWVTIEHSDTIPGVHEWTQKGFDIYRSSNVGVGDFSADTIDAPLHVKGNVLVQDVSGVDKITMDTSGTGSLETVRLGANILRPLVGSNFIDIEDVNGGFQGRLNTSNSSSFFATTFTGEVTSFADLNLNAALGSIIRLKKDTYTDGNLLLKNGNILRLRDDAYVAGTKDIFAMQYTYDGVASFGNRHMTHIPTVNTFTDFGYYSGNDKLNPWNSKFRIRTNLSDVTELLIDDSLIFTDSNTLATGVTNSSLTSVGNLTTLTAGGNVYPTTQGNLGQVLFTNGAGTLGWIDQNVNPDAADHIFGSGIDGDIVSSTDTVITTDMYYNNLTLTSTSRFYTNGFRVFVKNTLAIGPGCIFYNSGSPGGQNVTGGIFTGFPGLGVHDQSPPTGGLLPRPYGDGTGGEDTSGGVSETDVPLTVVNGLGGKGGPSTDPILRPGGAVDNPELINNGLNYYKDLGTPLGRLLDGSKTYGGGGGRGGRGGSAFNINNSGGGGGAGGGNMVIVAKIITIDNTGGPTQNFYVKGGDGGNSIGGDGHGGGGGGGGNVLIYTTALSDPITIAHYNIERGAGGAADNPANNGGDGDDGRFTLMEVF